MKGQSFLFAFLILCPLLLCSQSQNTITIQSHVVDANNKTELPYATIYNLRLKTGTASDLNGSFTLPNNLIGDTLLVRYLGYKENAFVIDGNKISTILLEPEKNVIDEIVITAKSDYLYKIVSALKKNKSTSSTQSKTYLYLETQNEDQTIELLEAYYNGTYKNNRCDRLELKKGRIGIKSINNRYFHSTESSRLFVNYNCFGNSKLFPSSPLSLSKRKLKKAYDLELVKIFNKNSEQLYQIKFTAKKDIGRAFNGMLILNPNENTLNYLELKVADAEVHPFLPIGGIKLEDIDMHVIIEYRKERKQSFIDKMHFNYVLDYKSRDNKNVNISTTVYTKAYDNKNTFNLPLFNFSPALHEDYRNITLSPYDSLYWEKQTQFRFYEKSSFIDSFVRENYIENNFIIQEFDRPQLEFGYLIWDDKRLFLKAPDYKTIEKSRLSNTFEIDRYNLNVQLYLDVVFIEKKPKIELYSIIDPVNTFYHFNINETDHAFINMYFDLLEIERRRLQNKLQNIEDLKWETVQNLYDISYQSFHQTSKDFVKDVNRGLNKVEMQKWNKIIDDALGIDNITLFALYNDIPK